MGVCRGWLRGVGVIFEVWEVAVTRLGGAYKSRGVGGHMGTGVEVTRGWGCRLSEWVRCVSAGDIGV